MARRKTLDFAGVAEPVRIGVAARDILQKTVDDGVSDLEMAKQIRLDLIEPDPDQPRKYFDEDTLRELAQSIRVQGVLQPIDVEWVPQRERFRIISGERRWRATRLAADMQEQETDAALPRRDLGRIPAIVMDVAAVDRYIQQVYENEQRADYSDVERAFAYERLKEAFDMTWEDLAGQLGLSLGRIHQIRRTKNRLTSSVQHDITSGRLTGRHGLALAPLPPEAQEAVAAAVKERRLTHHQTQVVAQQVRGLIEPPSGPLPAGADAPAAQPKGVAIHLPMTLPAPSAAGPLIPAQELAPASEPEGVEGVTCYTLAEVVERAVEAAVTPPAARSGPRRGEAARALSLMRQLTRLDLALPADPADRAALADGLEDVIAWAETLRDRLRGDRA